MNFYSPRNDPYLNLQYRRFFCRFFLFVLFCFVCFFNESATKGYIDRGRHHKSDWKTKRGGAGTDEGWEKKKGIISG